MLKKAILKMKKEKHTDETPIITGKIDIILFLIFFFQKMQPKFIYVVRFLLRFIHLILNYS